MTTEPSQNPDFIRKHPKEGMEALEKESKLPLKGWENEVARAKEFGLEAAKSIVDPKEVIVIHQAEEGVAKHVFSDPETIKNIESGGHIYSTTKITSWISD